MTACGWCGVALPEGYDGGRPCAAVASPPEGKAAADCRELVRVSALWPGDRFLVRTRDNAIGAPTRFAYDAGLWVYEGPRNEDGVVWAMRHTPDHEMKGHADRFAADVLVARGRRRTT